jgi:hypothetical protein
LIYIMWLECTLGILNYPTYTFLILFGDTSVVEFRNPNFFGVSMFIWQRLGCG